MKTRNTETLLLLAIALTTAKLPAIGKLRQIAS